MKKVLWLLALLVVLSLAFGAVTLAEETTELSGALDQLHAARLEVCRLSLVDQVKAGTLTQEQADAALALMQANMAACDGTSCVGCGMSQGARNGCGMRQTGGCGIQQSNGCGMRRGGRR